MAFPELAAEAQQFQLGLATTGNWWDDNTITYPAAAIEQRQFSTEPRQHSAALAAPQKKLGRPPGSKNSGPRKPPGQKVEERRQKEARGEIRKPGRPKGKADSKPRAKAGEGENYAYGKTFRARKAAEKGQSQQEGTQSVFVTW